MVDPIGVSCPSTPAPRPFSAPRPDEPSPSRSSAFDDYRNDVTQVVSGVLDEVRPRLIGELKSAAIEARIEIDIRGNAVEALEARARELVANGAPEKEKLAAFGNLRLEQKDLFAAEARAADLSDIALKDRFADAAGNLLGMTLAVDDLVRADREVRRLAETDPRAAWRKALSTSFGVLADGSSPVSKLSNGGLKAAIGDVGLGALARRLGERVANATFDPINRLAHKLAEQPWWPKSRPPRNGLSD